MSFLKKEIFNSPTIVGELNIHCDMKEKTSKSIKINVALAAFIIC